MIDQLNKQQKQTIAEMQVNVPVHVVPIAEKFGLKLFRSANFPDALSGLIKKVEGTYHIHINGNHPITRQRFTMAHELAHYLLHKNEIGDGITDDYLYRSELTSKIEREANDLAAQILMPVHLLKKEAYKNISNVQRADEFWVSAVTMDIRFRNIFSK